MAIDLTAEDVLSLAQAAALIPPARRGKKTCLGTLIRWVNDGVPGPDGRKVRLEAIRLGNRWMTTRAALQRFAEALTPDVSGDAPRDRTPRQRIQGTERAARKLAAAAI